MIKTIKANLIIFFTVIGAVAVGLIFLRYGFSWETLLVMAVSAILLAVAYIDFRTSEIPDILNIALVPLSVLAIWIQPDVSLLSRGVGFFAVSLPMLLLALVISGAFGGGDIKLMAVCGFLLGWQNTVLAFFIALLLGGSYAIHLMLTRKRERDQHMVFGPALCAGVFVALLYGNTIISWYIGLLGF